MMNENLNEMHRIINHFVADSDVQKRLEGNKVIHAKIKYGDKIYNIVMEEVVSEGENISIEFEDEPPKKHPDFTE